ncbi:MAG: DNA adenine methylase [Polyangiales bacterium]
MIKYIGSKRLLIPHIVAAVNAFDDVNSVLDLFSGTSRVGQAMKREGFTVHSNDHLTYAATLARCYVQADRAQYLKRANELIDSLNTVDGRDGYFTKTFCEEARYFQPKNGQRVDAIRDRIAELKLEPALEAIALTSLMEAADRVDSTTGVQMAYLKKWASRAYNDLSLRVPELIDGDGFVTQLDATDAARTKVDLAYLDPPYNQHSYMGNYHVWETLVRWDKPDAYGVAMKRTECRDYKSDFNSKRRIDEALRDVIQALNCRHVLLSFSNEGFVDADRMMEILRERWHVGYASIDFKRYVGAQIGVYNPSGDKVGEVSHLRNKELLFVASDDEARVQNALQAIQQSTAPNAENAALHGAAP